MKLRDKKDVITQKANERKKEIDEGMKLAKNVDILRETVAKEQSNLRKFREESLKLIQLEIDSYSEEKKKLKRDVEALKEQKNNLIDIPIAAEWKKIEEKNRYLNDREIVLNTQKDELNQKEKELVQRKKTINIEDSKSVRMKKDAENTLNVALIKMGDADTMVFQAENKISSADRYVKEKQKLIVDRDITLSLKESNLSLRESSLDSREAALNDKEKQVNDRYETLLRTIKRNNNN